MEKWHLTYLIPLLLQSSSIINFIHLLLLLHCRLWQNLLISNTAKPLTPDILMNAQVPFPVTSQLDCCSVKFWEKENSCMDLALYSRQHSLSQTQEDPLLFFSGELHHECAGSGFSAPFR